MWDLKVPELPGTMQHPASWRSVRGVADTTDVEPLRFLKDRGIRTLRCVGLGLYVGIQDLGLAVLPKNA